MTLYVVRTVGCDHPGCFHEHEGLPGERAVKVRAEALSSGWARVDGNDYCPRHWPAAPTGDPTEDEP